MPKTTTTSAAPPASVTPTMKRVGAAVLANATEVDAKDLVTLIYQAMEKARRS